MEGILKGLKMSSESVKFVQNLVKPHSKGVKAGEGNSNAKVDPENSSVKTESSNEQTVKEENSFVTMGEVVNSIHEKISKKIEESLEENDYFVTSEFQQMKEKLQVMLEKSGLQASEFFSIGMNMQWEVEPLRGQQDFKLFMDVSFEVFIKQSRELSQSFVEGAKEVISLQDKERFESYLYFNQKAVNSNISLEKTAMVNFKIAKNPAIIPDSIEKTDEFFNLELFDQ